ncbi:hypothetical protein BGW42_005892 [Actinomortierella wolfii]|nr:hypothetical protein BGW42_005892 [Actinomortierella wolfii]
MTVDDQSMQTLWKLTNDLTTQLVFNRNATLELKQQLADLKAKITSGSYTISDDIPASTHPSGKAHAEESLRIANERLTEENIQLQEQLREYERWIEYIMTKFRLQNFAMVHSRKEVMQEAYKIIEQERELNNQLRAENAALQQRLVQVGSIARRAINDEYYKTETLVEMLMVENQGLREMLGVAESNSNVDQNMESRQPGYRVSFPSTGSYNGSSEGDEMEVGGGRIGNGDSGGGEHDTTANSLASVAMDSSSRVLNDGSPLTEPPSLMDTIPRPTSHEAEEPSHRPDRDESAYHDENIIASIPEGDHSTVGDIPDDNEHMDEMDEIERRQDIDGSDFIRPQPFSPSHSSNSAVSALEQQNEQQTESGNSLEHSSSGEQQQLQHSSTNHNQPLSPTSPPPPLLSSPTVSAVVSPISINTDVGGTSTTSKQTSRPRKKRTK